MFRQSCLLQGKRLYAIKKFVKTNSHAWLNTCTRATWNSVCQCASKQKRVIHVKLKSWLRPLGHIVPYLNIRLSPASFGNPGWLGLPSIPLPSCHPVYDLLNWSGQVPEGHSFRWWHLCSVLESGPRTWVQSPQCTLSMDIWCTTGNKPRVPWCRNTQTS